MSLDKTAQADSWSELQALEVITNSLMSIVCVPATGSLNCMLSLSSVTVIQREINIFYRTHYSNQLANTAIPLQWEHSFMLSAHSFILLNAVNLTSISIIFTPICYLQSISISRLKQNVCLKVLRSLSLDLLGTHNEV